MRKIVVKNFLIYFWVDEENLPKMDEQNNEIMYSYGNLRNCRNGVKSSFEKN